MLEWNESYSVGVKYIDNQHKELLDRINKLLSAMKNSTGKNEVLNTLNFLEEYVIQHFNDEEELQRKNKYYDYTIQHKEHEILKKDIMALRETVETTGLSALFVINVQNEIIKWWNSHIVSRDKELGKFLQNKL